MIKIKADTVEVLHMVEVIGKRRIYRILIQNGHDLSRYSYKKVKMGLSCYNKGWDQGVKRSEQFPPY